MCEIIVEVMESSVATDGTNHARLLFWAGIRPHFGDNVQVTAWAGPAFMLEGPDDGCMMGKIQDAVS